MEEKMKINNQVVCMRKFVKQGKIRIINKFVKEIQLLRNRKGGEQKISKCQRKADRLVKEVAILKKIKPDTVSRIALSKSKDWKAVLSQKGVSLEDRCFALLASYGPVQMEVDKFYSENSYLTFKIPTLIQEWVEKKPSLSLPNSIELNSKSDEITKNNPSHSAKKNKSKEVKSGKQSSKPKKQSVKLKDADNCGTLKVRGSEDMMVDDSGNEGTKDTRSGHCEVSNRNKKDSDDNEEGSDDSGEESGNNLANSDDNERDSDESDMHSDDEEKEEENSLDLKNKSKASSIEDSDESDMHSDEEEKEEENSLDLKNKSKASSIKDSDESDMHSDEEEKEEENSLDLKNKSKASSIKESKMKSKPAKKDSNILSLSPVKTTNDFKNKIPSLQKNVPLDTNSTKAVALVNLNELMDLDEIPIVSSKTEEKQASKLNKRKKDSFFLKDGEEEFSESGDEHSNNDDDGTFNHKNVHGNSFNKKSSFAHQGRTKMEDNARNFRNKGFSDNAPRGKKFERGDQKFGNDFHSKQKFNKFNKNDGKPYSEQQNFKRFNKNDSKPYSDQLNFKKNKWNRGDESDRKGSKPFSNFQEKKQTYSKNKPDNHPRNDLGKTVKKDAPPLHPSWEAKRKLKQATNTKFQGKRMVFDD